MAKRTYASYERNERVPDALMLVPLVAEGWDGTWLLTGTGLERQEALQDKGSGESQDLSQDTLKLAVQTVEEARREAPNLRLSPEQAGEVVLIVYQLLCSGLAEAEVLPFTRRALNLAKGDRSNAETGGSKAASGR